MSWWLTYPAHREPRNRCQTTPDNVFPSGGLSSSLDIRGGGGVLVHTIIGGEGIVPQNCKVNKVYNDQLWKVIKWYSSNYSSSVFLHGVDAPLNFRDILFGGGSVHYHVVYQIVDVFIKFRIH